MARREVHRDRGLVTPALLVLALCAGCAKHPPVTVGVAAGAIGFGACMVDDAHAGTCGIIGGGAAVLLGGLTALIMLVADTGDHSIPPDEQPEPEIIRKPRTHAVDAGVDAPVPAPESAPADAGVVDVDAAPPPVSDAM